MRITWRKAVGVAVACLILYFMIRSLRSGIAGLGSHEFVISPLRIAGAFATFAILFPVYGAIWKYLLGKFGYSLPYGKSLKVWLVSQAGRYVPGKVWFALGRIYLCEREGVPKAVTTVATGLELALVLASSIVVFGLVSALTGSLRGQPYAWSVLLVPAIVAAVHPRVINRVVRLLRKGQGELAIRYSDVLKMLAAYVGCWFIYGLGFYLVGTAVTVKAAGVAGGPAFGVELLPQMIGINALAWTVGFISVVTPAGLGVREGVAFSLLSKVVDKPYPSLIPLAARVWVTIAEVAGIGIAAALGGWKRR